ncbi:MAG: YihY/virulence factor BrkB family protein, partial [Desulfococcaceae bacterium]
MENKTEDSSQEKKSRAVRIFDIIRKIWADSIRFLKKDIWTARPEAYDPPKSVLIRAVRLFLVTIKKFNANDCVVRASALTYFTLLSVVPIAALAFGIASGFGFKKMLRSALLENLPGQAEAVQQVIDFAEKLLENTQGGLIAGIGIIVLFWAVIRVLGQFEMALNAIWEVNRPRSIIRKISDYLSIMFVAPIFLIMSGSAAVFLKTQLIYFTERVAFLEIFGPVILFLFRWTP